MKHILSIASILLAVALTCLSIYFCAVGRPDEIVPMFLWVIKGYGIAVNGAIFAIVVVIVPTCMLFGLGEKCDQPQAVNPTLIEPKDDAPTMVARSGPDDEIPGAGWWFVYGALVFGAAVYALFGNPSYGEYSGFIPWCLGFLIGVLSVMEILAVAAFSPDAAKTNHTPIVEGAK